MNEDELIDLTEIFDKLFKAFTKFWKVCLALIIACTVFIEAKTILGYHPTYTSSMTVIATSSESSILVLNDQRTDFNESFQKVLMSSSMMNVIKEDLGMSYVPASINVSLVELTNFIVISATADDPQNAYNVVKFIENNYGQVTKLLSDANIIIIDEAKLPTSPNSTPNYFKQAIVGMAVGIVLSIAFICVYALTRNTISKEEQIKNKLHLKRLGSIPEISMKKRSYDYKEQLLVSNKRIPSSFKESFRTLVLSIQRKKNAKVFMITSTLPNEGKSTVSSNIALMLAQENKKVVLIDFDLRNPSLYKIFKLDNPKEQIGDYLDGKCHLNDIITNSEVNDNLDIVLGSQSYDHSIEMLSRDKVTMLIELLKESYDYVIIDVPPVLMMQDALSVVKHCDSTILVIKQDFARTYEIIDALDELYEIDGNIMGCVLNVVKKSIFDEDSRGYGYGYGYGKTK